MTKRIVLACILALVGCEKTGGSSLGADDAALLKDLPAGNVALMGGNYMKLQNFMQSAMGQVAALMDKIGPGMSAWMSCFTELKNLRMAGSVKLAGMDATMRFVLGGASVDDILGCAQKANFKTNVDADRKFFTVELPVGPGATAASGYLVLPGGVLYSRQAFAFSLNPKPVTGARADIEGDIAALGKNTAADDPALKPLIAKVDHGKTVWLVGSGAGTLAADKVGGVWATFDLSGGLALDITAQLKVEDDAKKAEDGFAQLRKSADQLPGDLKDVVKGISFTRSGGELHLVIKVSDAQVKSIISQLGMLGGGLLGGAR